GDSTLLQGNYQTKNTAEGQNQQCVNYVSPATSLPGWQEIVKTLCHTQLHDPKQASVHQQQLLIGAKILLVKNPCQHNGNGKGSQKAYAASGDQNQDRLENFCWRWLICFLSDHNAPCSCAQRRAGSNMPLT